MSISCDILMCGFRRKHRIHPNVIHRWKKELLSRSERVFAASQEAKAAAKEKQQQEEKIENLYAQVGRLTTQLEWLKKNLLESCPVNEREAMVNWDIKHPNLTFKAQAELLCINRTGLYRPVREPSALEVKIKRLIDRLHTEKPFKGSRRI